MRTKKTEVDRLISKTFNRLCSGVPIQMMAIPAIFEAGRAAVHEGRDLDEAIKAAVDKARVQ